MSSDGYILVTCEYRQEGKVWVGVCRELGTSAFGDTVEEAREALDELVMVHLNALEEVGERERFFREHGIKFHKVPREKARRQFPTDKGVFVQAYSVPIPA